jgi:condensation domain-containing protein
MAVSQRWPASAVQRWLFQVARAVPDVVTEPGQTLSIVVRVRGPLDVDLLDRAYDRFVARHELLRTRLVGDEGGVWQEVDAHRGASLHRVGPPVGDGDEPALVKEWTSWPVPLLEPPVVRGFVAERGPGHHLVGLTFHHAVVAPSSLALAMRDLAGLYRAPLSSLPPPPMRYGEYAAWQHRRLAPRAEHDRRVWSEAFADIEPPRYRTDVPFVPGRPADVRELRVPLLAAPEVEAVERWSWRHRSTMLCSLLAAFARTWAGWTDARDLPLGTVFEQRDHPAVKDMVGPFVYASLMRVRVEDGEPWDPFVRRVRAVVTEAYGRAQTPRVEFLGMVPGLIPGATGAAPSWLRTFQYIPTDPAETFAFGAATGSVLTTSGPRPTPWEFGAHLRVRRATGGGMVGRLGYDANELTEASARSVLDDWVAHVRDMLASP